MSTTTSNNIPEWLETASRDAVQESVNLTSPYLTPRTGMTAGLNNLHQQAMDMASGHAATSGNLDPAIRATQNAYYRQVENPQFVNPATVMGSVDRVSAPTLASQNLNTYINPYTENVLSGVQGDMSREHQQTQSSINARAAKAGAFGGSRHALMNAEATRNYYDRLGNVSNQVRSQAYQNAQSVAQQDLARQMQADLANQNASLQEQQQRLSMADMSNRWQQQGYANQMAQNQFQLQAANQMGSLMNMKNDLIMNNANVLQGLGNMVQATEQRRLDEPWKALEFRANLLNGVPTGTWTNTQENSSDWEPYVSILGSLF